jgi:hypothetical protein
VFPEAGLVFAFPGEDRRAFRSGSRRSAGLILADSFPDSLCNPKRMVGAELLKMVQHSAQNATKRNTAN